MNTASFWYILYLIYLQTIQSLTPHFRHSLFLLSITILLEPTKPQHQQQSAGNRPLSILVTAAKCSRKSFTAQQKKKWAANTWNNFWCIFFSSKGRKCHICTILLYHCWERKPCLTDCEILVLTSSFRIYRIPINSEGKRRQRAGNEIEAKPTLSNTLINASERGEERNFTLNKIYLGCSFFQVSQIQRI